MTTFRYIGTGNGTYIVDPETGKNVLLEKGKDFTTESAPLIAELRLCPDVEEADKRKPEKAPVK